MKNNEFEKFIGELPPELQEKARQCRNGEELNRLLAENDVELSEDALEMAAGGLGLDDFLEGFLGDPSDLEYFCPECGQKLLLYDWWHNYGVVYICGNQNCAACREQWLFYTSGGELRRLSE